MIIKSTSYLTNLELILDDFLNLCKYISSIIIFETVPSLLLLSVRWSVCGSVMIFLKGRKLHFHASIWALVFSYFNTFLDVSLLELIIDLMIQNTNLINSNLTKWIAPGHNKKIQDTFN